MIGEVPAGSATSALPINTDTPTPTDTTQPTSTDTPRPTDTESPPTATPSPAPTDTPRPTQTFTPTDTPTDTPRPTETLTPTNMPTDTPTATATDTPRPTPTLTLAPTNTSTPSATATPTVTLPPPPIRLIYDQTSFVMINNSSRPIDIRSMIFVLESPNGLSFSFNSSMWIERMNGNNFLSSGACVQLILLGSTLPQRPDYCRARAVWIAVGSSRWFWLSSEENAAFEVRQVGDRLASCPINAGECDVYFES